jgi:hypothetical protein
VYTEVKLRLHVTTTNELLTLRFFFFDCTALSTGAPRKQLCDLCTQK